VLDLRGDVGALTAALVDIPSVSGEERAIADAVEAALREQAPHLEIVRDGDAVVARTNHGRASRVLLAGHLDTVPVAGNLPSRLEAGRLYGCGATDMKSADAVMLRLASDPTSADVHDLTVVFYDHEEVAAALNGLGRLERNHPEWLAADLALVLEPTDNAVEAGCQGTMRAEVTVPGKRAHPARAWLGENAIHAAAPLLARLAAFEPRRVVIDGLEFREGLQAVKIAGGVAGNVVPDSCVVTINHRFAPDHSEAEAEAVLREIAAPYDVVIVDSAPGALPRLGSPLAQAFCDVVGTPPAAKLGWTDASRFSALGMPALNFGPGDSSLHSVDESVSLERVNEAERLLRLFLTASG
jgi:succinyl-diaminopimelate desuccinylase